MKARRALFMKGRHALRIIGGGGSRGLHLGLQLELMIE